ncbi:LacI family transcriptional regulator [Herbiconiux sp. CPCC 205763]|uniref:LacI family transcriptional regulator n=1 Tax=Herbiconiux aconitum TaxID=2970913 RepID=A0ABT2GVH9_9MICO|nr:LacI family DNA-binding transcriptional regulator [Herbiconiux aconitum]MCS5720217.1 LacI family transcriptional regulator [Herbiconiux aconitum]
MRQLDEEGTAVGRAKSPRQSDIARAANVSQATVSMVLNGRASENGIPEATQKRISAALAEAGYVPNAAARSLRGGRNGLIGVHTFERVFPISSEDYYNEFLNGIEEQAVDEGLDLVLFASTQRPDGSRSIYGNGSNRLRLADGAIMLGFETNDDELVRLAGEGYPFVFIGRREVSGTPIPYVTANYHAAMEPVVRLLTEHGHRGAVYLGSPLRRPAQRERLAGIEHFAGEQGLEVRTAFRDPAEITAAWLEDLIADGATAIIAETYDSALPLHEVVNALGVDVPGRLSVVCLESDSLHDENGSWSRVGVPRKEMGRRAVRLLLQLMDGAITADHVEIVECEPPSAISIGPAPLKAPIGAPAAAPPPAFAD